MKREETTNTFQEGMVMDFNPLVTPNNVLTNCLNGTLLTFNGNEYVLQNDMGNGRVETAFLPEGYVPLGTTELGGIIYIVSYNPFTKKCQIGSFPSPERNITSNEVSNLSDTTFTEEEFKGDNHVIKSPIIKKKLTDIVLHTGDKFLVCGNPLSGDIPKRISHYDDNKFINKYIDFRIATVDENGKFIYLTDLRKYRVGDKQLTIQEGTAKSDSETALDEYRKLVSTNYQIFTSKAAGELYVVGQLEVIDYIESINWNLVDVSKNTFEEENLKQIIITSNNAQWYKIHFDVTMVSERQNIVSGLLLTGREADKLEIDNTTKDRQYRHTVSFDIAFQASQNDSYDLMITPCMEFGILEYLKETIHFDFSLLGSNQVTNNIWKYWRDENSMQLRFDLNNYHVNQNIRQIRLKFQNLEKDKRPNEQNKEKNWTIVEFPIKESYAGINTVSMLFTPDFIADSIYIIQVEYKLHSDIKNEEIEEETKKEKWKYAENSTHILYTNGIYNQLYTRNDTTNFDLEYLPLKPTMELLHIPDIITFKTENKLVNEKNKFVSKDNPGVNAKIQGETIYTTKGKSTVSISTSFENTFNKTFSLDRSQVKATFKDKPQIVINQDSINIDLDSEYFTPYKELKPLAGEKININLQTSGSGDNSEHILDYDILLKSPISATYGMRSVGVDNYYASVLHTQDDFYKLGMVTGNIEAESGQSTVIPDITLDLTGPGLGITAGGRDNDGGGGIRYVYGFASVINEGGNLSLFGEAPEGYETSGKPGIKRFPNDDISQIISKTRPSCSIVPVFLLNIGTSKFKYNNEIERRFNGTNNRGGANSKQTEWFNTETPCDFAVALLFGRAKESENFVPLDYGILIKGDISEQKTYLKRYCALLSQLYSKRIFEGLISIYTVGSIGYINRKINVTQQIIATTPCEDDQLLLNNNQLTEIKGYVNDNFRIYTPLKDNEYWKEVQCFSIKKDEGQNNITITQDLTFNFDITNKYLDIYEQYRSAATIPAYVASNQSLEPPSQINSKNIYVVEEGKLVTKEKYPVIYEISDLNITDGEINPVLTNKVMTEIQDLSMFAYDDRYQTLGLVNQGQLRQGTFIAFGSGTNTKYTDNTYLVSAKIDTKQTLNNLPS